MIQSKKVNVGKEDKWMSKVKGLAIEWSGENKGNLSPEVGVQVMFVP